MTTTQTLNGIAVDKLQETIALLETEPELAQFHFRARNRWIHGTRNRAENPAFYGAGQEDPGRHHPHTAEIDEPPVLLGEDRAANPAEHLLNALSGCVTTTFVSYAAAQGVSIKELTTELEGDLDVRGFLGLSPDVRPGYDTIRVRFHVTSDAPREQIEALIRMTEERSPILDSIRRGVPVSFSLSD